MGLLTRDDGWRIPDEMWERIEPLLPPRPRGCPYMKGAGVVRDVRRGRRSAELL